MKIKEGRIRKLGASLANIVLFLSIFVVLFPLALPTTSAATWYVYPGGSIQDAITDADDGDTIFVYAGTYEEQLTVDKILTIEGEDKDTTIIDAQQLGTVIEISASSVTVTGFTIKNGDPHGIHMTPDNDNNKIWDCDIANNVNSGIFLESSGSNNIYVSNTTNFTIYTKPTIYTISAINTCQYLNNLYEIVCFYFESILNHVYILI